MPLSFESKIGSI